MFQRVAVVNNVGSVFKILLQNVRVGRLDSFVIILFQIDDLEAKLLVELDGAFVVHLNVSKKREEAMVMRWSRDQRRWNSQEYVVEVPVGLNVLEDVI